jgi:Platelet-activating factor acetylhydrolase, isoform II
MRVIKRVIKIVAALALFAVLGIAALLGWMWLDHNRETTLPTPTGPFAVSRTTSVWSDAQTDSLAPQPGIKRELFVWTWYPAAPPQPSQTVEDYLPVPWRTAVEHQWGVTKFLGRDLSRVRSHSIRGGELSPHQRLYPVVLMLGGFDFTSLAEDLASHGYVVVSFDAPYRSSLVVFPDGRIIERTPQNDLDLVSGSDLEHLATKLVQAGSADMSFALDQLERLNVSDPSGKFLGRLDLERVGAFGHSIRGATALQFCHDDSRCKASIDLDGMPFGSVVQEGVAKPVLFLMSDHSSDSKDEETSIAQRNFGSIFARLPSDLWSEITIRGANHYMFSDDAVLRSPVMMRVLRTLGIVGIDGRRQVAVARHFIDTFFDVHLNGSPTSELNAQAEYPEVKYVH